MYYFKTSTDKTVSDILLSGIRAKAIRYIRKSRTVNTLDVFSERGYQGNVHITDDYHVPIWTATNMMPASDMLGDFLDRQYYLDDDGKTDGKPFNGYCPWNVYR